MSLVDQTPPTDVAVKDDARPRQEAPRRLTSDGRFKGGFDKSQMDVEAREVALENMGDNLHRLPETLLARYGRPLGVFHPAQGVIAVAVVTLTFGDPRYHTMADLGVVVLAAVAACALAGRLWRRRHTRATLTEEAL